MKSQKLGELIAERAYSVPPEQRGYSWKAKHVNDFINDLVKAHDEEKAHQFGLIVTHNPDAQTCPAQIIDGQQRITTALLFLICARNFFYKHQKDNTAGTYFQNITKMLFMNTPGNPKEPRLTLSETNNTLFQKMLAEPTFKRPLPPKPTNNVDATTPKSEFGDKSNELLLSALDRISPNLKRFATDSNEKLNFNKAYKYVEALLEHFTVLTTFTTKHEEIYQIFELINNRGVKLSPADQVKAYMLSRIEQNTDDKRIIKQNEEKWRDIANNVTNKTGANYTLEKFLNHYLIINKFYRPPSVPQLRALYEGFRALIQDEGIPPEMIIDEILEQSETFEKIRLADQLHFEIPDIVHYLKKLNKMRVVYAYPVILGGYKTYWKSPIDFGPFDELVSLCCKYHMRKRIMAMGNLIANKQYEKKLHDILKQILERKKLESIIERTMIDKYPTDDDLRPKLKTMPFTDPDFTIALLEEVEYSGKQKRSRDDTSLEHIVPEDTEHWETDILEHKPKSEKDEDYIRLFREEHYRSLGNLTLLSKKNNASASNKKFDEKLIVYGYDPTYKITTALIGTKQWDGDAIKDRTEQLAETILVETDIITIRKRLESRYS